MKLRGQGGLLWKSLPLVEVAFHYVGREWNHFYGWMLDRQEKRNSIASILQRSAKVQAAREDKGLYDLSRGTYHVDYLCRHGLKPDLTILDFGCGFGRTGIPLIKFLGPGRYIGVEISKERIRLARDWTTRERLDVKQPTWIVAFDNALPYLDDQSVDMVWAQSVLTHMPQRETEIFMKAVRRVLRPSGLFLFNFAKADGTRVARSNVKDYQYPSGLMQSMCTNAGLSYVRLTDWQDDLSTESRAAHNDMIKAMRVEEKRVN